MKRFTCLFIALCLLLAACGSKPVEEAPAPSTAAPTEAPTTEATQPPTTEATEPETEPETEPTEPPVPVHPLTGEPLEEAYTGRPLAFSLNNISACLPQYGMDAADWMFEVETEGGITRCMCIVTDPTKLDTAGPIRSSRTYFLNLSVSYNAPLFHCGGSQYNNDNMYSSTESLPGWDHIDQHANDKYFYRESSRNGIYAFEHTLFTTGERMAQAMEDKGFNVTSGEPVSYGYQFSDQVELDGQNGSSIDITFLGSKRTTMKYDAEAGLYEAYQYGGDWIEGSTGENITFRNVLVVLAEQSKNSKGRSFYDMDGTGDGYFAVDGKMIPIQWHHNGVDGPFQFTMMDGTPITLGVGRTYCAIVSTKGSVSAE